MKTLQIIFTILSAFCIAAFLLIGTLAGWGYAAVCAAAAFCFFSLMLVCKQRQKQQQSSDTNPENELTDKKNNDVNRK